MQRNEFDLLSSSNNNVLKKTTKTCPLCRTQSDFVIPSSVFPTPQPPPPETPSEATTTAQNTNAGSGANPLRGRSNLEKERIVNTYLTKLKKIPCRYFEESVKMGRERAGLSSDTRSRSELSPLSKIQ